jgi:cation diffusion facilitator CzcD-associated flavoprotein CzcO
MFTLGFSFRPWPDPRPIAGGPAIRRYVNDTARGRGVDRLIRFGHKVVAASWSSDEARWTVDVEVAGGERTQLTASFLFGCTGYYDYDQGYEPELPGAERFEGLLVHPQKWAEGTDYGGKQVVVIGSGATAVTLVPAMTDRAQHVTMLQRTPSYVMALPETDPIAWVLQKLLPERTAASINRWKNVGIATALYRASRRWPERMSRLLRGAAKLRLPKGYDMERHFTPPYAPWDQRLCFVPHGDLFDAITAGDASVVTDRIETFTEDGIKLESGTFLPADIVIQATGLQMLPFGGMRLEVDGDEVSLPECMTYKGTMLSGVPNFAASFGYTKRLGDADARARRGAGGPVHHRADLRLRAARRIAVAQAGRRGPVAQPPGLPDRPPSAARGADRRPHDVRASQRRVGAARRRAGRSPRRLTPTA